MFPDLHGLHVVWGEHEALLLVPTYCLTLPPQQKLAEWLVWGERTACQVPTFCLTLHPQQKLAECPRIPTNVAMSAGVHHHPERQRDCPQRPCRSM